MLNPTLSNTSLSLLDYKRYSRQLILKEIKLEGQKRLQKSKILCVGAGGLASCLLMSLASIGVGTIGIIDQ